MDDDRRPTPILLKTHRVDRFDHNASGAAKVRNVSRLENHLPKSRRLIIPSFRPAGFSCQDQSNLFTQDRTAILGGAPDDVPVDAEVGVNKNIAKGNDLSQGTSGWRVFSSSETRAAASPIIASF